MAEYIYEKDGSTDIWLDFFEQDEADKDTYYRCTEEFTERGYEIETLQGWAEEVGFEVLHIFDADTKKTLNDTSERALFVCRKHGTQLEYQSHEKEI